MTIRPDSKNWTWVLQRPCDECGFDAGSYRREAIGDLSRQAAAIWPSLLATAHARTRPDDATWSALEYGCHVRDVFRLGLHRLRRMLGEDDPMFDNWDQDQTAIADRYELQDPAVVAGEICAAGEALAAAYESVDGEQWDRPGMRSDGSPFTVESFGRYFLHDPIHHIVDVRRGNEKLSATG
jgi:hypothetical protein